MTFVARADWACADACAGLVGLDPDKALASTGKLVLGSLVVTGHLAGREGAYWVNGREEWGRVRPGSRLGCVKVAHTSS